jgi:hypothetical protein
MRHTGCWALLCMMYAFVAPLGAEVNNNGAAIFAALTNGKSREALVLISQAFSALKPEQATEAKNLIESTLAVTPIDLSGKVVVTAIEANPSLGEAILSGISDIGETEKLAILNQVSFAASREPQTFNFVSESLPRMVNSADANISVSDRLTAPDYNPSNLLSETGVMMSPTKPELRKDLIRDEAHLADDFEQLLLDEEEHKSKEVIEREKEKIKELRQDIKELKEELKNAPPQPHH